MVRAAADAGQRLPRRAHLPRAAAANSPTCRRRTSSSRRSTCPSGKPAAALAHVWPLLAFIAGMLLASHIKSGRMEQVVPHSLRWTMGVQAVVLAIIGFVPASVAHTYVTVPISFGAAVQIGLFRNVGDLAYLPVATTGNMMRFMESAYDGSRREAISVASGGPGLRHADPRVRLRGAGSARLPVALGACTQSGCLRDSSR